LAVVPVAAVITAAAVVQVEYVTKLVEVLPQAVTPLLLEQVVLLLMLHKEIMVLIQLSTL
jgi:hypothetical protein